MTNIFIKGKNLKDLSFSNKYHWWKALCVYLFAFLILIMSFSSHAKLDLKNKKGEKVKSYMSATFITSMGTFKAYLFNDKAPKTVENFVGLATGLKEWTDPKTKEKVKKPLYKDVIFHRVIEGFMIQTGSPLGTDPGSGGPGYRFEDEFHPDLRHSKAGILSMANAGKNTNGSQFFITVSPQPRLDDKHAVFGEVFEGMDVVNQISKVKTGPQDRPITDVIIKEIIIEK